MQPFSGKDWGSAGRQALTGKTKGQYKNALELIKELLREGVIKKSNLTLTGSSLGGGLAAYVGSQLEIETVTFNAAGVHPDNVGPHTDMVTNYHMMGDTLTAMQNSTGLPNAIGTQIRVIPTFCDIAVAGLLGPGYLHYIGKMERALKMRK